MLRSATRIKREPRKRTEKLKTAVLDAARKLCFAEGVEGVSARKIAREVGCSATAIYLYYKNLDDVLHHLRMEGHLLLAQYFREVAPSLPPAERLIEMGRAYHRFGVEHPNYYQLMFLYRFKEVPRREFIQQEIFTLLIVRDVIRSGMDTGAIRGDLDPMVLANGVWSNMHGLTSLAVAGLLLQTAPGQHDELLEAVLDGIRRWIHPQAAALKFTSLTEGA
jgi:AcrR family transcriptional regulator